MSRRLVTPPNIDNDATLTVTPVDDSGRALFLPDVATPVRQFLSTDGNGGGSTSMTANAAITPIPYYIQPPAGKLYTITNFRWTMRIETPNTNEFGDIPALPVGNRIVYREGSTVILDLVNTPGAGTLRINEDIVNITTDYTLVQFGASNYLLTFSFEFHKNGLSFRLRSSLEQNIAIILQDNQTTMISNSCRAIGYAVDE